MKVFFRSVAGVRTGFFTDSLANFPPDAEGNGLASLIHLTHVSSIQKIVLDDRVEVKDDEVVAELAVRLGPDAFNARNIEVDGQTVRADAVTWSGWDFLFGNDVRSYPFVVFRRTGETAPWPALRTVKAAGEARA